MRVGGELLTSKKYYEFLYLVYWLLMDARDFTTQGSQAWVSIEWKVEESRSSRKIPQGSQS